MITYQISTSTSFVNLNEKTGIVAQPKNHELLAKAMQVLFKGEELAHKMELTARERYGQFFLGPEPGQAYASLYKGLL